MICINEVIIHREFVAGVVPNCECTALISIFESARKGTDGGWGIKHAGKALVGQTLDTAVKAAISKTR
jgi:hypothetical protein